MRMADLEMLNLSTKDVMQGLTLTVRMSRSFTIRTKLACWLLGLAGRVMDVPCEVEFVRDAKA